MKRDMSERLASGQRMLIDGATGSELQRRGVDLSYGISADGDLGAWSATAMRDAPETVRAVHEDYLRVGAEMVTTNSFWTNRVKLGLVGLADKMEAYTRLAAQAAIAARDAINPSAFVAGGMAPPRHESSTDNLDELSREFTDQAEVLVDAGVDVLLPEYVGSVAECVAAVDACTSTGVPVLLGVRHVTDDGDMQYGESFTQLVDALGHRRVEAILVMCSLPGPTAVAVPKLRAAYDGPIGAYANIGYDAVPKEQRKEGQAWHVLDAPDYPPERFAAFGRQWLEGGAQIIGGCCATTPAHIEALRDIL